MNKTWTSHDLGEMSRQYQAACVLTAAADLDLFNELIGPPQTSDELAGKLGSNPRATAILLDALAALGLLVKENSHYSLAPGVAENLTAGIPGNVLAMTQHQGSCLRRWAQLSRVVKTGKPAERTFGVRGEKGDQASFIEAMDNLSGPRAEQIVRELGPLTFTRLLDVGGASGTWTIAFLNIQPAATATLFDLPHVIPMAERRLTKAEVLDRVTLVPGNFSTDPLPAKADLVWISAILHQDPRSENRKLLAKAYQSLEPGGRVLIRDVLMESTRTTPVGGALFAINMLTATDGGWTFTFDELREELESVGFQKVTHLRKDDWMDNVVSARKP